MIYLPDVNVWVALASARHAHNKAAAAWMRTVQRDQVAFCRITELGLLRLLMNVHVMGIDVRDAIGAWTLYDTIRGDVRVTFLGEGAGMSQSWRGVRGQLSGGTNALTDAYLAVFAAHVNATVVTFDRGFKSISGCTVLIL